MDWKVRGRMANGRPMSGTSPCGELGDYLFWSGGDESVYVEGIGEGGRKSIVTGFQPSSSNKKSDNTCSNMYVYHIFCYSVLCVLDARNL